MQHHHSRFSSSLLEGFPMKITLHVGHAGSTLPVVIHEARSLALDGLDLFYLGVVSIVWVPDCRTVLHDRPDKCCVGLGFGQPVASG